MKEKSSQAKNYLEIQKALKEKAMLAAAARKASQSTTSEDFHERQKKTLVEKEKRIAQMKQ